MNRYQITCWIHYSEQSIHAALVMYIHVTVKQPCPNSLWNHQYGRKGFWKQIVDVAAMIRHRFLFSSKKLICRCKQNRVVRKVFVKNKSRSISFRKKWDTSRACHTHEKIGGKCLKGQLAKLLSIHVYRQVFVKNFASQGFEKNITLNLPYSPLRNKIWRDYNCRISGILFRIYTYIQDTLPMKMYCVHFSVTTNL